MLNRCSPTLLALALGLAPLFGLQAAVAPAEAERDEHARAVRALIDLGAKTPARRQIDAWAKAGYTDTSPSLKQALETVYGVAFEGKPEPKPEPSAPKIVQEILGNQGGVQQIVKLLNESRKILDPDAPKPLVPPNEERTAALQRTVTKLTELFAKDFKAALETVKKHKDVEDKLWELDEKKDAAKIREINQNAVLMRLEALKLFYFAHMALREAATRGADFGLDPKPVNAALAAFCKEHKEAISEWEFQWADQHPQLLMFCAVASGEGVRHKIEGYSAADAEASLLKVCDLDIEQFPAGVRDGVRTLQATAWANLLRWQLEQGTDASYARGIANFNDFKARAKDSRDFSLSNDKLDNERAAAIGQIHLLAGRLHRAKGDNATATSLFAAVRGSRNPLSHLAGMWFQPQGGGGVASGESAWGKDPLPSDPSSALTIGRALLSEADNANPKQQREYYLNAAVGLRDGVLGLNTRTFADQFPESGAAIYRSYARALARLGMAYHAAAAAQEGLRLVSQRMGDKAVLARWKERDGKTWTKSGEQVKNLAGDALAYGYALYSKARSAASKRMYDDTIELAKLVDPEMVGPGLEWQLVLGLYNDGDYQRCIDEAKAYAKKYPDAFLKAASLIVRARQAWIEKLDASTAAPDRAKLTEVSKDNDDAIAKLKKYIDDELKKPGLTPERKKELQSIQTTISTAAVRSKIKAKAYEEVITKDLGHNFWMKPPADMDLRASMLRFLAQAVHEHHLALSGVVDPKVDKAKPVEAEKLVAAWSMYAVAMADFSKQMKALGADTSLLKQAPLRLAQVAQVVGSQAAQHQKNGGAEIAKVIDESKRYFADFVEPTLTDRSRPASILAVAYTLWEIGEKARAVRLFEMYKVGLEQDDLVKGYRSDAAATLAPIGSVLTARQEFRAGWEEVVDLLTDPAGYTKELIQHGSEGVKGRGEQRNFAKALVKIDALKALVTSANHLDAETKKKMLEACDQARTLAANLNYGISIDTNLAQHYRESGQAAKAVELYRKLYNEYDPLNPAYAAGFVEGVLQALRSDRASITDEQIKGARIVAGKNLAIFERLPQERDNYWLSWLQVFELSKALGSEEAKKIKTALEYTVRNRSSPRDDLIEPVRKGDDARARRARNQSAVDIAKRYLALFEGSGLEEPFRVETIIVDGKEVALFVDRGAPAMQATAAEVDGEDTIIITATGEAPAPAPAPAPAGGDQ